MLSRILLGAVLLLYLVTAVAAKPKGESTVVGCLLVELSGSYPKNPGPVFKEQDVRIACLYHDKKGRTKETSFHVKTDTAGYFKLEKVPAGIYVLKAVDFLFERASRITLASKFGRNALGDNGRYWGMMNGMMMDNVRDMLYDHIEGDVQEGVIDLGITYIQIKADVSASQSGMGKSSPDGKPPWLRINMMDRGSNIDLFLIHSAHFSEMQHVKVGESGRIYNMLAPADYFGLK